MSEAGRRLSTGETGTLVVVATPIGNLADLSRRAASVLASADVICCEDTRHTGQLLAHEEIVPRRLLSLHAHNERERVEEVLALLAEGATVALVSDAGTPLVSDPGERLVVAAIAAGARVTSVPGPSAVLAALTVSGMATARWRFEGFLPRKGAEREERLLAIAAASEATVCFESPVRVRHTLAELAEHCGPARPVAVARELTKLHEEVWRGLLGEAAEAIGTARGEYVVVVAPAPAPPDAREAVDLAAVLSGLLGAGLRRRDAVIAVEQLLGVAHREAYEAALALPLPGAGAKPGTD